MRLEKTLEWCLAWCLMFTPCLLATAGEPIASRETIITVAGTLAADEFEGRGAGSPGHDRARDFLIGRLQAMGCQPRGSEPGSFEQPLPNGANLLGVLYPKGVDQGDPTVLISAHYDHLGSQCPPRSGAKSSICNGAADNAGGVAAAIAAAEMLVASLETPVAIALWDNEELAMAGSAGFCKAPTFPLTSLRLMINFDILGLNLYKGLENCHFVIGDATGGQALQDDVKAAAQGSDLDLYHLSYAFGHGRSDTTSFFRAEIPLPFVFFSDGDGTVYHSTADEFEYLNIDKILAVATLAGRLALTASAANKQPYPYQRPKTLGPNVPPLFEDAPVLAALLERVLSHAGENGIAAEQVTYLQEDQAKLKEMMAGEERRVMRAQTILLFGIVVKISGNSRALSTIP